MKGDRRPVAVRVLAVIADRVHTLERAYWHAVDRLNSAEAERMKLLRHELVRLRADLERDDAFVRDVLRYDSPPVHQPGRSSRA